MDKTPGGIIEERADNASLMDRAWMASFWEAFVECVIETDANFVVTNLRLKEESPLLSAKLTGNPFFDFVVERDRELVTAQLASLRESVQPYVRFQFLSRLNRYYRFTLVPFFTEGKFSGCRGVAVDVTEQTLKEITLTWQRAILEGSHDFISISDSSGNLMYINPGAYKMVGHEPATGAPSLEEIFTPDHLDYVKNVGLDTVAKTGSWIGLGNLIHADGSHIPIEHTIFSVNSNVHDDKLLANVISDITSFVEHERRIAEALRVAESASLAKSEFLSRMSHEIRTPMNAIIGMISIGLRTNDIDRKNYCLSRADNASKHLLGIINDILDMSKIEAAKLELSNTAFSLEKMLNTITNMANVRAEEKGHHLVVLLSDKVPTHIMGDEMRLTQVLTNLLSNAIKFTPEEGSITLRVGLVEETDSEVTLQMDVTDSGIGISEEQQSRLFSTFSQADANIAQQFGGTGLGLSISKSIIELMGGTIWITSELGKGSTFSFTIKTHRAEDPARNEQAERISAENIRVLVVDDSKETRDYFAHIMAAMKIHCDIAADGLQALHMVTNSTGKPYNIFFIDWMMPEVDGIELTRRIRSLTDSKSVVYMISANDWQSIRQEATDAGVNRFLSKPLFPSTLANIISDYIGAEVYAFSARDSLLTSIRPRQYLQRTILIAEDVEINREIMSAILEDTGVTIDYAENGRIAVMMYSTNPNRYDMILMDINMPEMDGYEATRQIRALGFPAAQRIPIVAMTANVFREDIERCLAAGMNGHTGKPVNSEELFAQLDCYLLREK